jgi:DNA replication and repair protein RecF
LALKLAELEAARIRGDNPIFLLDDLSSELDKERTNKLLELLSERENQIWITTTEASYLSGVPFSKRSRFLVEHGTVKNM